MTVTRDGVAMTVPNLKNKLYGSGLACALLIGTAYGAGTGQWWLTTACVLGIGYMLGMTARPKQKTSVLTA